MVIIIIVSNSNIDLKFTDVHAHIMGNKFYSIRYSNPNGYREKSSLLPVSVRSLELV